MEAAMARWTAVLGLLIALAACAGGGSELGSGDVSAASHAAPSAGMGGGGGRY